MAVVKLDILALRNIQHSTFSPSPYLNFITGSNGSGKTSLLEALFILGRAKSFRTHINKQLVQFEQPHLVVCGQIQQSSGRIDTLGIQLDAKQSAIRINQQDKQKADLAYCFPVQAIHPKSYRLIDGGSQLRREFLDWGVFHQHTDYLSNWRKFNKALQQRNAVLKARAFSLLPVWNHELQHYAEHIAAARQHYLQQLHPIFLQVCDYFLHAVDFELQWIRGWNDDKSLAEVLLSEQDKDVRYGFTHSGSHRDDLQLLFNRRAAKDFVSRGQLKLLVLSLLLAQVQLLNQQSPNRACLLIDDLTAELDADHRQKLVNYLATLDCQVFMTSTQLSDFGDLSHLADYRLFCMEHGEVMCCKV